MNEETEQSRRKALEKRGLEACEKYEKMFNQVVGILMPDCYPTSDKKYLEKVEECIKRGTPLTDEDIEEICPTRDDVLY